MNSFIRQFTLLRYVRNSNRKGEYPKWASIKKKMNTYLGGNSEEELYSSLLFERDKEKLRYEWGCNFKFINKAQGYWFEEEDASAIIDDLLTSYLLLTTRNKDGLLPEYVIAESRINTGAEHIATCMEAIEEHYELQITYYDYRDDTQKNYTLQPYKLKHKDYKWYVLAVDTATPEVAFKAFALERISKMKEGKKFKPNTKIDFYAPYTDAFGMFTDAEAQKVVLQFDRRDGNYLKASPIHHSQQVIAETPEHITIELYIKLTLDFIMELMKRSWSLTVLEPTHLRDTFVKYWQEAVKRNTL
nr:WYL domain-containing protein [uncultured Capnocytophaga sp.]